MGYSHEHYAVLFHWSPPLRDAHMGLLNTIKALAVSRQQAQDQTANQIIDEILAEQAQPPLKHKESTMAEEKTKKTPGQLHYEARIEWFIKAKGSSPIKDWVDLSMDVRRSMEYASEKMMGGKEAFLLTPSDPFAYDAMWEYVAKCREHYGPADERTIKAKAILAVFKEAKPEFVKTEA